MKEQIVEFLQRLTGNPYLTVALISAFPLIELKGAIPVGEALGLKLLPTAALAYFGSTIVAVVIFLLLKPFFALLKRWKLFRRFAEKVEGVFERRAESVSGRMGGAERMLKLGVFLFVAVPLPLTGVWTGTAIAVFLGLDLRRGFIPVAAGNLVSGSIVTLLTFLFRDYVEYIILGLLVLAILMLAVFIVKVAVSKPK